MSRLQYLFEKKHRNILNVYCTAGYPNLNDTLPVMKALQEHGADIIELGMPYSDPLADGPVIQQSNMQALANGISIKLLFEQLKELRPAIQVPVVLMGYMNPVLQYGFERFCADASAVGVDGLILPDLPPFEFEAEYGAVIRKYGLDFIFLVTPETPDDRIRRLDALSSGFLYAVSASSTTGGNQALQLQDTYFSRLQRLQLANPVLVGFGIRDKESFEAACRHSNGAIIGSAYIRVLAAGGNPNQVTKEFLNSILR